MLTRAFLAPYRGRDPFPSLLARASFRSKYSRLETPDWSETVERFVCANIALDPSATQAEAEALYRAMWCMGALPPGRGIWTGGVRGIPADARYNCWGVRLRSYEDWCWGANMLMLGGGVGYTIAGSRLLALPGELEGCELRICLRPTHPDVGEVQPDAPEGAEHATEDSREGWIGSLRELFRAAWAGRSWSCDVSQVRCRGSRIVTFGGIACGPGPLVHLLRSVWAILRGAAGRELTSVEKLDITNLIGQCIVSGNVRRSALIVVGDLDDAGFRRAKHAPDWWRTHPHRSTSNNSVAFTRFEDFHDFDWGGLVHDLSTFGEPGLVNFAKIWQTDPWAFSINPCGEVPLHDREACNLAEVFPAVAARAGLSVREVLRLTTRYALRQRLEPLLDAEAEACRVKNMRLGVALGGLCDFPLTRDQLGRSYRIVREEANTYADELGVARPNFCTTVKPSGTISLLNGSAPGMHAHHARYYLRRMRIARDEPIASALIEAGVPHEEDVMGGNRWVFAFPTAAPEGATLAAAQTLRDQFERQLALTDAWSDNAVSATISYSEGQEAELASLLAEYAPRLKSTSCLRTAHGYAQAPYEEISEAQYRTLYARIRHDHPLAPGEIEQEDCAGGACPIR